MLFLFDLWMAGEVKGTEAFSGGINLRGTVFVVVDVAAQVNDFDAFVAS